MLTTKKGFTVGLRLASGFGLVLLLLIIVTAIGIQKVRYVDATLTQITDVNSVKQRYAINFRGSVHDRAISLRDVVLVSEEKELREALADIDRLAAFYAESAAPLDKLFAEMGDISADERSILASIKEIEAKTLPLIRAVIDARNTGRQTEAHSLMMKEARPAFSEWLLRINRFIDFQEKKNQDATAVAREVARGFAKLMIILCAVAIGLGALIAWLIVRYLNRALGGEPREAAEIVSRIAAGDLTTPISPTHPDSMLSAIADMQGRLREIFSGIITVASTVSERAEAVEKTANNALQSAEKQSSSSAATAASVEEMTVSIQEISEIARQTEENSAKTAELSQSGVSLVEAAANELVQIADMVSGSAVRIRELQQRSMEIGGIANVIKEIADQTNLLALNAAIEAARAGETGRGFAVVADEVRKLAERTASATAEIARMIELIQNDTQDAVSSMETTVPQVQNGLTLAKQASSGLREILLQADASLRNVRDVATATAQQASTTNDIARNVEQIARMSSDTSDAMVSSTLAAKELEQVSHELKTRVSGFRLA
jgi:methyl-accepting chemotaxis protein